MKKENKRSRSPQLVLFSAADTLKQAAVDLDTALDVVRFSVREASCNAKERVEREKALSEEANKHFSDDDLRKFFVGAVVDARNGFDLDAEAAEGTEAAARCAHEEIDRIRRMCQESNAAADAAEKELAELEFELAEFRAPKDYELALDAVMPNDVSKRVVKAFGLSDCNITTVGDAVAAISERAASDATLRAYQWIGDMMSKC